MVPKKKSKVGDADTCRSGKKATLLVESAQPAKKKPADIIRAALEGQA